MPKPGSFRFTFGEIKAILGCSDPAAWRIIDALGVRPRVRGTKRHKQITFNEAQVKVIVTEYHRLANKPGKPGGAMRRARKIPTAAGRLEALWAKWARGRRAHAEKALRPKSGGTNGP